MLTLFPLLVFAQNVTPIVDAWEVMDKTPSRTEHIQQESLLVLLVNKAINFYQSDISTQSVSRCPFKTSCSNFAKIAVSRYGIFGLAMFIDRYYYRENIESFRHYRLVKNNNGVLKLDDDMFLYQQDN